MKNIFGSISMAGLQKKKLKKIPWVLGSHAFLMMLFFIAIAAILAILLFYNYVIVAKAQEPSTIEGMATFGYTNYQRVLDQWQARQKNFQESSARNYANPFR